MQHPPADEVLERLWYAREESRIVADVAALSLNGEAARAVDELAAAKLVRRGDSIELTPEGVERAQRQVASREEGTAGTLARERRDQGLRGCGIERLPDDFMSAPGASTGLASRLDAPIISTIRRSASKNLTCSRDGNSASWSRNCSCSGFGNRLIRWRPRGVRRRNTCRRSMLLRCRSISPDLSRRSKIRDAVAFDNWIAAATSATVTGLVRVASATLRRQSRSDTDSSPSRAI